MALPAAPAKSVAAATAEAGVELIWVVAAVVGTVVAEVGVD